MIENKAKAHKIRTRSELVGCPEFEHESWIFHAAGREFALGYEGLTGIVAPSRELGSGGNAMPVGHVHPRRQQQIGQPQARAD